MFGIINFEAFLIAGLILNLTPGADTMYILGRSIAQGKKAGILSALGISTGAIFHIIFATLGLSIILAKSAMAFEIIKYLGAGYLIFLGLKTIFKKTDGKFELNNENETANYKKIYFSGIMTNILNPKVALFFLAFLPQFIDPNYVKSSLPFLILGITFLLTGTIWCLILALFASKLSDRIRKSYKMKMWLDKITGGIFVALGIKLALMKK
ncbi:LysE family translocator [Leeuwenhoekiella marinoflava]|uniref:RhtB (Resistance to homoserine/threonine) family protein n=2 Tax=Leeuwenhoekiella marinoflava TaxID=988 RepID=A0A4Q0PMW7_9FLAO|nr:LysE family translocator [Leeuwenhoekiella marinoflava]RXG31869.1 RhtB (resistance to homoserine/threonine) family protein [Leeuwenhoekiella marinoflava]SHF02060.1 resistance to homoserine/threonine (RhtB) family protein [Leeuwenhoekiella marinoflava DSM 3653]